MLPDLALFTLRVIRPRPKRFVPANRLATHKTLGAGHMSRPAQGNHTGSVT
jgi:hypothetical protein